MNSNAADNALQRPGVRRRPRPQPPPNTGACSHPTPQLVSAALDALRPLPASTTGSRVGIVRVTVRLRPDGEKAGPVWPLPEKARDQARINPTLRAAIRRCLDGEAPWPLLVHGEAGSGKTCAGLLVVEAAGGSCYSTVPALCRMVADAQQGRLSTYSLGRGSNITVASVWADWHKANICCLDEIGCREKVSDHHCEVVKEAIDLRVENGRPLIAMTNFTLAELAAVYTDPIASRLGSGTIVATAGDRRLEQPDDLPF